MNSGNQILPVLVLEHLVRADGRKSSSPMTAGSTDKCRASGTRFSSSTDARECSPELRPLGGHE
jgi:hypothetical protein